MQVKRKRPWRKHIFVSCFLNSGPTFNFALNPTSYIAGSERRKYFFFYQENRKCYVSPAARGKLPTILNYVIFECVSFNLHYNNNHWSLFFWYQEVHSGSTHVSPLSLFHSSQLSNLKAISLVMTNDVWLVAPTCCLPPKEQDKWPPYNVKWRTWE